MENLLSLAKQTLSIVSTATAKDQEIKSLIQAGILDMQRRGIDVTTSETNQLKISTIMMFVKGHFGNVEIKEKELAQKTYELLCLNLSLSEDYRGNSNV